MNSSIPFTLRNLGELVFRHKKKFVFFPLLCLVVDALVILFCPRTYQSEAKVFLRVGRESVGRDATGTTGQTIVLSQMDRKDEIKSAVNGVAILADFLIAIGVALASPRSIPLQVVASRQPAST